MSCRVGLQALQVGIMATGNFGFFNVLTSVLCLTLFDSKESLAPVLLATSSAAWLHLQQLPVTAATISSVVSTEFGGKNILSSVQHSMQALLTRVSSNTINLHELRSQLFSALFMAMMLPLSFIFLVFNSWVALSWPSFASLQVFARSCYVDSC